MSPYCHNPPLGTRPKAKIRIRTPYAAAPCGSVTKIACKMSEMPPTRRWRTSNRFFAYFGASRPTAAPTAPLPTIPKEVNAAPELRLS